MKTNEQFSRLTTNDHRVDTAIHGMILPGEPSTGFGFGFEFGEGDDSRWVGIRVKDGASPDEISDALLEIAAKIKNRDFPCIGIYPRVGRELHASEFPAPNYSAMYDPRKIA